MTSKATIRKQIEGAVAGNHTSWHIGVTGDPVARKAQLGTPLNWLQWEAESEPTALDIQDEFVKKGMLLSGSSEKSGKSGKYIYIFTE